MITIDVSKLMNRFTELQNHLKYLYICDHYYEDIYCDVELPEDDYDNLCAEIESIEAELGEMENTFGIVIVSDEIIKERIEKCVGWIKAHEESVAKYDTEDYDLVTIEHFIEEQKALKAKYEAELRERGD